MQTTRVRPSAPPVFVPEVKHHFPTSQEERASLAWELNPDRVLVSVHVRDAGYAPANLPPRTMGAYSYALDPQSWQEGWNHLRKLGASYRFTHSGGWPSSLWASVEEKGIRFYQTGGAPARLLTWEELAVLNPPKP
ncbi:MAG: hypothetical protein A3J48_04025 [Candidatus Doudnabacteria bacterium RIFCSPHIGHO2_02_FULL_46_11]|uniref:Uncharacterized protein n=1 Tax=Candidatus Doudnabacteria bacterium RIFCSPHIGHO2_02_FULL_46_11 TaxID=1817832 RepID=A0A1F5P7Z5_9BACT|nr:MAG: hypothetical protein A3J48_04025 [Candidatus Doudnabacteria bacterium RIFCSPHIGHO2_02_FULL_46_11]